MDIRHGINLKTNLPEPDRFEAINMIGQKIAECELTMNYMPLMYPDRPCQIQMFLSGDNHGFQKLAGAGMARGFEKAKEINEPARVFVCCDPENRELIEQLMLLGFDANDALWQMSITIPEAVYRPSLPEGITEIQDKLEYDTELKFFAQRYNALYDRNIGPGYFEELAAQKGFSRFMLLGKDGLCAEMTVLLTGGEAAILSLYVPLKYRRKGYATALLRSAAFHLVKEGAEYFAIDARSSVPGLMDFLMSVGFRKEGVLEYMIGVDWEPADRQDPPRAESPAHDRPLFGPYSVKRAEKQPPKPEFVRRQQYGKEARQRPFWERDLPVRNDEQTPQSESKPRQPISQNPDDWN